MKAQIEILKASARTKLAMAKALKANNEVEVCKYYLLGAKADLKLAEIYVREDKENETKEYKMEF